MTHVAEGMDVQYAQYGGQAVYGKYTYRQNHLGSNIDFPEVNSDGSVQRPQRVVRRRRSTAVEHTYFPTYAQPISANGLRFTTGLSILGAILLVCVIFLLMNVASLMQLQHTNAELDSQIEQQAWKNAVMEQQVQDKEETRMSVLRDSAVGNGMISSKNVEKIVVYANKDAVFGPDGTYMAE